MNCQAISDTNCSQSKVPLLSSFLAMYNCVKRMMLDYAHLKALFQLSYSAQAKSPYPAVLQMKLYSLLTAKNKFLTNQAVTKALPFHSAMFLIGILFKFFLINMFMNQVRLLILKCLANCPPK